jgi:glycosyltransferase involved in cell wall biosynthesis
MRVAFLSYAPIAGGVSTFQSLHIEWLHEQGVQVALLDEDLSHSLERVPNVIAAAIETQRLPLWSSRRRASADLRRWLGEWRPDLMHVSNPALVLMYAAALHQARRGGCRTVLTQHSEILVPTLRRALMAAGSSIASLGLEEVTYVSAYTRRWWERRFPWLRLVNARVTPNGVPLALGAHRPRSPEGRLRVGFVGRLSQEKGVDRFLDVARLADAERFSFFVFGDGAARDLVRKAPAVVWRGHESDPARIFSDIDLLLVTSPIENCPFVVLEARAFAVPTVAAAVGGLPELISPGEDGELAPRLETSDFLGALDRAAASYDTLTRGCLASRERWTLELAARRLWGPYILPLDAAWKRGA